MLLGSCASDDSAPVVRAEQLAAASPVFGDTSEPGVLVRFRSCDDVAPAVAAYIDGLVPGPVNKAGSDGVNCAWEAPAGASAAAMNR